jgi:hypothetical protein
MLYRLMVRSYRLTGGGPSAAPAGYKPRRPLRSHRGCRLDRRRRGKNTFSKQWSRTWVFQKGAVAPHPPRLCRGGPVSVGPWGPVEFVVPPPWGEGAVRGVKPGADPNLDAVRGFPRPGGHPYFPPTGQCPTAGQKGDFPVTLIKVWRVGRGSPLLGPSPPNCGHSGSARSGRTNLPSHIGASGSNGLRGQAAQSIGSTSALSGQLSHTGAVGSRSVLSAGASRSVNTQRSLRVRVSPPMRSIFGSPGPPTLPTRPPAPLLPLLSGWGVPRRIGPIGCRDS